ncbi:hypothetical protein SUGI_0265240 [Cryptomeria japonica]|nr:hypothetical protein SUGI_0265240 [Cryptomeria japonica]
MFVLLPSCNRNLGLDYCACRFLWLKLLSPRSIHRGSLHLHHHTTDRCNFCKKIARQLAAQQKSRKYFPSRVPAAAMLVIVVCQKKRLIPGIISLKEAHSNVLSIASPVLKNLLKQQKGKSRHHSFSITGVPYDAARVFIRFLYSSRYEQEDMQKFALHLLVLSHVFLVPSLKLVCTQNLEHGLLTTDNVIDMIQLARLCDASRLNLLCMRLILKNFKAVSKSEGWKVMRQSNPKLEQELLESVVEADSQKQERLHKIEEKRIYLQLYDAMEALVHICRDGCRTIGPHDKDLDDTMGPCNFPACKGLESLVRHFAGCKTRVPGGCVHCKRMWQLLELHSRMCYEPDVCKVPLCRHFKEKVQQQSKKDEVKWKVLVSKVQAAKRAVNAFSSAAVV